jgi:non-ribosomal peptide synthase protein (TIGR01720 family)
VLGLEKVGVNHNFFKLGGDSILSIQVIARARQAGIGLMPRQIFEKQTIAELALVAGQAAVASAEQGMVTGEAPLAPFQKEFFAWQLARPDYFNQSVLLGLESDADTNLLEQAVLHLLKHHDALRMKYAYVADGWQQICEADVPSGVYARCDLTALEGNEQQAALEQETARAQASLDLKAGRLMKALEFDLGAERGRRLLLVIHHLVVDGVSWRILVDDVERGYKQLSDGKEIELGLKTTSFKEWAERLKSYAEEDRLKREFEYWASQGRKKTGRLPLDLSEHRSMAGKKNLFSTQKSVISQLTEEETRALLQDVPSVYNTQINDVLLTALARVLGQWSVSDAIAIDLEGHGREEIFADVDLSRTVGWCTITYPVVLEARREPAWHPGKTLSRVKEQLRAVPNRGLGCSVLRYLTQDNRILDEIAEIPSAEIIFNYLGQVDQVLRNSVLLSPAQENSGVAIAPENRRPYLLDVSGVVIQGKLQMNWSYSDQLHRRETIEKIAARYMDCVREMIQHCRSEEAGGFTPSDFPVAEMTQKELAQIASLLAK